MLRIGRLPDQSGTRAMQPTSPAGPHDALDGFQCPECAYDLRGLPTTSERCPECGEPLSRLRDREPQIPWARARGFWRAYPAFWSTVWLVMASGRRFRSELARPVSYRAAQWFRGLTVVHVALSLPLLPLAGLAAEFPPFVQLWEWTNALSAVWLLVAAVSVFLATGAPSYLFHPRYVPMSRQNRGVALSYYTCAPLALMALSAPLLGASLLIDMCPVGNRVWRQVLCDLLNLLVIVGLPLGAALVWWISLLHLAAACTQRTTRVVAVAVMAPLMWLGAAILAAAAVPLLVYTVFLFFC